MEANQALAAESICTAEIARAMLTIAARDAGNLEADVRRLVGHAMCGEVTFSQALELAADALKLHSKLQGMVAEVDKYLGGVAIKEAHRFESH